MCFVDGGDYPSVSRTEHRVARKPHRCDECRQAIKPRESYDHYVYCYEGSWGYANYCERCLYYQALIYAHEVGDNDCSRSDSWYPLGDGEMRRYMRQELGWRLPGDSAVAKR